MKKTGVVIFILFFILSFTGIAQIQTVTQQRPALVLGIVVDQMRWDYLYRYYDRYAENGGFKRLLQQGFNCDNTMISYINSVTACGHASIYTGAVPAIHGITGNDWWDNEKKNYRNCVDDENEKTVGSNTIAAGAMSPRNLLTTTICDELKLASNFKSKVIGIALKDRGGILPAGHSADAAYWYDTKTGNWISSTYYIKQLPTWVSSFNERKLVDSFYAKGWNTLYPIGTYTQSTADDVAYENRIFGPGFPYSLTTFIGNNYNPLLATPYGNTLTTEFAKATISNEKLGTGSSTDFLAISYSSPDYVGHSFGPNSIEEEDIFLRLDQELGTLLDYLDAKVGKGRYLLFLSADHGAAHIPAFLKEKKIPAGNIPAQPLLENLNAKLKARFGKDDIVTTIINDQIVLNKLLIESEKMDKQEIKQWIIQYFHQQPEVMNAVDLENLQQATLNSQLKNKILNGYYSKRSGDIQLVYVPQWIEGFEKGGTTHASWYPYDAHIPLLWYGWNIKQGKSSREIAITDIAATLAALLNIQMPSGCTGKVIEEIFK